MYLTYLFCLWLLSLLLFVRGLCLIPREKKPSAEETAWATDEPRLPSPVPIFLTHSLPITHRGEAKVAQKLYWRIPSKVGKSEEKQKTKKMTTGGRKLKEGLGGN